jgi:hypothetical protein
MLVVLLISLVLAAQSLVEVRGCFEKRKKFRL